jgi:hypothetical protein
MVWGIVADGQHAATADRAGLPKQFEELQKLSPLNLPASRRNRNWPSRKRTAANWLARGVMVNHWVLDLGRRPHATSRSLLLKVHFVESPKIDRIVFHQFSEFFYVSSVSLDRL